LLIAVVALACVAGAFASEDALQPTTSFVATEETVDLNRGQVDITAIPHEKENGMIIPSEFRFASRYDSGGCTPLIVWEDWCKKKFKSEWFEWEKRLPDLADKVKGLGEKERAAAVFDSLAKNKLYFQYIDGRSQKDGENAFGPEYIGDMKSPHKMFKDLILSGISRKTLNMQWYDDLHTTAFKRTATKLKKDNGFRSADSYIYLPMPDKPLGIFHNVHYKGKLNYDQKLRVVGRLSEFPIKGWKHNRGYQWRWKYPNLDEKYGRQKVQEILDYFWDAIEKIPADKNEGQKRAAKLTAVTWLYHALENFHPFIDGNGRSNILMLNGLLSWAGLHPVSFYNSMESALAAWEEEREVVLEGYLHWEESFKTGATAWTEEEIERKGKECQVAVDKLTKKRAPAARKAEFVPDTLGGCMCKDQGSCGSNEKFADHEWCYTDSNCMWGWDYCAAGRSSRTD